MHFSIDNGHFCQDHRAVVAGVEQQIISFLKNQDWRDILQAENLSVTESRSYSDQLKIDVILHDCLSKFLPTVIDAPFISEESEPTHETPMNYWLVDPLDGTNEYRNGVPEYAVSIAFIANHQPEFGVIFNPATGEYFASDGTFLVKRKDLNQVSKKPTYLLSRSEHKHSLHLKENSIDADYIAIGGTAYKLGLVASKKLSMGYVTYQPKSLWDIGAGCAILRKLYDVQPHTLDGDLISFSKHDLRIPSMIFRPRGC